MCRGPMLPACLFLACVIAGASSFSLGNENTYSILNDVTMTDIKNVGSPVSYRINGNLKVGAVFKDEQHEIVRFQLSKPKLLIKQKSSYESKSVPSGIENVSEKPFYALFHDGSIEKVFLEESEDLSAKNFKKSLASLFQFKQKDATIQEEDITGLCDVVYISWPKSRFTKTKINCKSNNEYFNERLERPLGVTVKSSATADYFVKKDGVLERIESQEGHAILVNAYPNTGVLTETSFNLKVGPEETKVNVLKGKTVEEAVKELTGYKEDSVVSDVEQECKENQCYNLIQAIKELRPSLSTDQIGTTASAEALVRLVPAGYQAKSEDFLRILKSKTGKEIKLQLLDVMAAIKTPAAHKAVTSLLEFGSEQSFPYAERYLQSLSVATRPSEEILQDLMVRARDEDKVYEKLRDTLMQTIASIAHRLARLNGDNYDKGLVKEVSQIFLTKLRLCDQDPCKGIYLRALGNLQAPRTIPKIFEAALEGSSFVSVEAMKALRNFHPGFFTGELKENLKEVFFQFKKSFDSSARALALDILLDANLEAEELADLIGFLKSKDKTFELKQYLLQKLGLKVEECEIFAEVTKSIFDFDPDLRGNYNLRAVKGMTTALKRQFSKSPSFNASLISIQEIQSGVLKRGVVDIALEFKHEKSSIFKLGLFANGMSSLVSESDDPEESSDDTPATAGMELAIQGTSLRPLKFFEGQSELMGHVWSGTASEPTPAYQGATLLQDHEEIIRLQNGAVLDFKVLGAVSIDLNGRVSFSLWNRNAQSKVEQNTGFALIQNVTVTSSYATLNSEITVLERPQLNLESHIDFSSGIALCMQLSQPETRLVQRISKTETVPKAKINRIYKVNVFYNRPGLTHVLNRKNNEMCAKLL